MSFCASAINKEYNLYLNLAFSIVKKIADSNTKVKRRITISY